MAACLAGVAIVAGLAAPASADTARPLAVMPFSFFDTSNEPRNQSAEHARRLQAMAGDLGTRLAAGGRYRLVSATGAAACVSQQEGQGQTTSAATTAENSACILERARQAGAELVLTGAVQKVSTMASQVWVGVFATADGKRVFYRQLSFRGDTDDAWKHATSFLAHQIEDAGPGLAAGKP